MTIIITYNENTYMCIIFSWRKTLQNTSISLFLNLMLNMNVLKHFNALIIWLTTYMDNNKELIKHKHQAMDY